MAEAQRTIWLGTNCLALCVLLLGSAWARELLTDPGFEGNYPHIAPGWSINAWGTEAPEYQASCETANPHEGASSQRLEVTGLPAKSGVILRQNYTFKQGHVYRARLWLRSPDRAGVQVLLRRSGPHYDAGAIRGIEVDANWQEVCIEGGFGDSDVAGFFGVACKRSGTVILDSASLVDITSEVLSRPVSSQAVPASLFGIHINKLGTHNVWPDLGAGMLRLWDTATCWRYLQPEPDRWEWTRLDYYLRHVQRNAPTARVLLTLGMTPDWAVSPEVKAGEQAGTSPPVNLDHWRNYVRTLGKRYKGRIHCWELWNESDYAGFYTGSPGEMLPLARIAWEELKGIDPQNLVLSPNVTRAGLAWLDQYLSLGGGQYADILSFHCYPPPNPEDAVPIYAAVRDLARAHGQGDKPIWNTEGAVESKAQFAEDEARGAVARAYLVQWAQGVQNFNWYCWDIHWPGGADLSKTLTGPDLAPGGVAYRELAEWMTGASMVRRTVAGTTWTVELKRKDGRSALIAWTTQKAESMPIPDHWKGARRRDLEGNATEIHEGLAAIGPAPVLLEPLF